jgi:hypothetical protein
MNESAREGRTLMAALKAKFGVSSKWRKRKLVSGHVLFPCASLRVMLLRSYVWPVATITGSCIISMLIGQQK